MARPNSITIKLTDKQRSQLRGLTGETHTEVKFEAMNLPGGDLASKSALAVKGVARKGALSMKRVARKSILTSKLSMR